MCGGGRLRDKPQSFRTFRSGLDQRVHCLPDVDPDSVLSAGLNQDTVYTKQTQDWGPFPSPEHGTVRAIFQVPTVGTPLSSTLGSIHLYPSASAS